MPDYSERSVEFYGKPEGPWRVKDTGALYAGITVSEINDKGWVLKSNSATTEKFLKRFAKREFGDSSAVERAVMYTFGLNAETRAGGPENAPLATEILFPEIKKQCELQAGIKF